MVAVCAITIRQSVGGPENLAFGLATSTWAFPRDLPAYAAITSGVPVLLTTGLAGPGSRNPRVDKRTYRNGTLEAIYLAVATSPVTPAAAPHWPDEIDSGAIKYPSRFALAPLAVARSVPLTAVPEAASDAFHDSINGQSRGVIVDLSQAALDDLARRAGLTEWPTSIGLTPPLPLPPPPRRRGAGRMMDAAVRIEVERRSVEVATAHYVEAGWEVQPIGKPYDLLCVRSGWPDLHVEVKGSTGLPANVVLTVNEVIHASEHPTELAVVRDIKIDRTNPLAPVGTGGVLRVFPAWTPAPEALRVSRYDYQVPW